MRQPDTPHSAYITRLHRYAKWSFQYKRDTKGAPESLPERAREKWWFWVIVFFGLWLARLAMVAFGQYLGYEIG